MEDDCVDNTQATSPCVIGGGLEHSDGIWPIPNPSKWPTPNLAHAGPKLNSPLIVDLDSNFESLLLPLAAVRPLVAV